MPRIEPGNTTGSGDTCFCLNFFAIALGVRTEDLPSVQAHSDKLGELGFRYKYGMEEILDGSIECAVRFGMLDASKLIAQG
jgi:hypothetical protein